MSYKERARAYFTAVSSYDVAAIERMVDENYIQHNPFVPTGRAAFLALIPKLKAFGSKINNIRMLEEGRHVVMHHEWVNAEPFGHGERAVAFHIIRFDDRALIVEHWNVMMPAFSAGGICLPDKDVEYSKQHKVFAEGSFKLTVSEGSRRGVPLAIYDLVRLEGARVAEHWQIVQEIPKEGAANENTMFGF